MPPIQPSSSPPPVLVLGGMHRSGTSLVAALCQSAGLDIGTELLPGHASNPVGHFEDLDFYRFHETVLASNGRTAAGYGIFDTAAVVDAAARARAETLVSARRAGGRPWGWKDPRTVLFLDFWLAMLPESRFLFVFRDPAEVADSLRRRGERRFQDGGDQAFREWYHANALIRDFCRRHPERVLVRELRRIIDAPRALCGDVDRDLGVPLGEPQAVDRPGLLRDTRLVPLAPPARGLVRGCFDLLQDLRSLAGLVPGKAEAIRAGVRSGRRTVAVVIPLHRLPLAPTEEASLRQLRHHLLCHDRILIAPESLDTHVLGLPTRRFADSWFASVESYSRLLLTREFYDAFEDYEQILVHQLDCLVFSSDLVQWCQRGWDYAGAPWFSNHGPGPAGGLWAVGNGGLSLRRVAALRRILGREDVAGFLADHSPPEDMFWSFDAPRFDPAFRIPTPREAAAFAVESSPRHCFELNGNALPFGCHYWPRIDPDFWRTFLVPEARDICSPAAHPLDEPWHPDHRWVRAWVGSILGNVAVGRDPQEIARLLTADMPASALEAPPTVAGMDAVCRRLLGRGPGQAWFDFWVGRSGVTLADVRRDLAEGPKFRGRCDRLQGVDAMPEPLDPRAV